ncbi:hypothetical protein BLA6860_04703 [Burkholderia lata]|uniref:hypothetical protein n=1 Tax=Burkholderia lata (strain ATCC 17760 / DSM 23089 / LMG 22485 / NCIMB 9086 / R18194 / 383) TaxID=482957 RepID=UPI0014543E33|nr:hypothetical protein [Burkholderia lata]VWB98488.1 hypothetical protein BLA6860_04703 [Burkholderia lata]
MKRYSELLQAKVAQEEADFEKRRDEDRERVKKTMGNRVTFDELTKKLKPEFDCFIEQIQEFGFAAVYSEQKEGPFAVGAEVIFRLHSKNVRAPLDRDKDCRVWIELDAENGVVLWDYHGDLPEYHANRIKTGKLGNIGEECLAALPLRLEECLRACLHGRRLSDSRYR